MLCAKVLRSPHPHARIRSIDVSKGEGAAWREGRADTRELQGGVGSGSIAGGRQLQRRGEEDHHLCRRYAFNNPRFVGEPVVAIAATSRHLAEEALRLIAVDYEAPPFVLEPEEALAAAAPKIWRKAISLEQSQRVAAAKCRSGATWRRPLARRRVFEDRYSTSFVHNAQMEPLARAWLTGTATS